MAFHRLAVDSKGYYINYKKDPSKIPHGSIFADYVANVFDFSYRMTFGKEGGHKETRPGGEIVRRQGQIFANAFQGKLAEYAMYDELLRRGYSVSEPDFSVWGRGKWDIVDLQVDQKSVSVKSTKAFGELLLLEERVWNKKAEYTPNNKAYDYNFLVRLKPYCEVVMKKNHCLYDDDCDRSRLEKMLLSKVWEYDIPGYVTKEDLIQIINCRQILPKGKMLQMRTKMDATNYYVQSGDLRDLKDLKI